MRIRVEDVEHGCCVMLQHVIRSGLGHEQGGRLAMIDSGSSADFKQSTTIKGLGRDVLDYLFITNADRLHVHHAEPAGPAASQSAPGSTRLPSRLIEFTSSVFKSNHSPSSRLLTNC